MNLTDRARKLFWTARKNPEEEAVEMIVAMLRVTRQEGIRVGFDHAERHLHNVMEGVKG